MDRVNQSEITEVVAERLGVPLDEARSVVNSFVLEVQNELLAGKRVSLSGFVSLGTRKRPTRRGRNPRTGDPVRIPAGRNLFVKTSISFKKDLNSKRKARTITRANASGAPKVVAKKAKKAPKKKASTKKPIKQKVAKKKVVTKKKATPKKAVVKKTAAKKKTPAKKKGIKRAVAKKPVKRVAKKAPSKKKRAAKRSRK